MLRYPDGQREQISLSSKAKLMVRTHSELSAGQNKNQRFSDSFMLIVDFSPPPPVVCCSLPSRHW